MSKTFPTSLTYNSTIRGQSYTNEFTDTISNLNILSFSNDYYLGWVRPEYVPDMFKACRFALVEGAGEEDDIVEFIRPSYEQNVAFGYSFAITAGLANNVGFTIYKVNNEAITKHITSGNPRLINTFYPEALAGFRSLRLRFSATIYNPVGDIPSVSDTRVSVNVTFTSYRDFMDFRSGRTKKLLNFKRNQGTVNYDITVEVTGTDFENGYEMFNDIGGVSPGWQAKVFLSFIGLDGWYFTGTNSTSDSNYTVLPMFGQTLEYHFTDSSLDETVQEIQSVNFSMGNANRVTLIQYQSGEITRIEDRGHEYLSEIGCPQQNTYFTQSEIVDGNMGGWSIQRDGLHMIKQDNNNQKYVYRYSRIEEIEELVNLISRVSNEAIVSYSENISYATKLNSNEFVSDLITGSIYDQSFRDLLQPWQYVPLGDDGTDEGTAKQEFDPTDPEQMPPYDPTPPGPEPENPDDPNESPEEGDPEAGPDKNDRGAHFQSPTNASFPVNPSPFVEYGIFDYSDLVALSVQLWNKPDSFFEALAGEQKVNPMDYFISLKWYPFALEGETLKDRLYLGSGGELTANYYQTEELCRVQDWGALRVQPYYNNFLDYDPYTKIFIYLPLCGQVELNSTIVMGKTIELTSVFDVAAGSLVWIVWNGTDGQPVLMKQCSIGSTIPISGVDAAQMSANIVNATLQTINNVAKAGGDIISSARKGGEIGSAAGPEGTIIGGAIGAVAGGISNTTNLISTFSNLGMASKEIVQLTGGTTGLGASGIHTIPAIIYQRPLATNPSTYGETVGFICNKTARIGSMSGFTICKNSNTNSIAGAIEKEKAQIKQILDSGFFV